jgi:hypothetical protein
VRSKVFTAVIMKSSIFWDVMLCGLVEEHSLLSCNAVFRECPVFQKNITPQSFGLKNKPSKKLAEAGKKLSRLPPGSGFL